MQSIKDRLRVLFSSRSLRADLNKEKKEMKVRYHATILYLLAAIILLSLIFMSTQTYIWSSKNQLPIETPKQTPIPIKVPYTPYAYSSKLRTIEEENKCKRLQSLRNVLLAINFNNPFYENIPLLKEMYTPVFGKVIFCGGKAHKDVIVINERNGELGYECIATAIRMYKNFTGYMHSNDDVLLHWWKLHEYDLTKIVMGDRWTLDYAYRPKDPWYWYQAFPTYQRCLDSYNTVLRNSKTKEGERLQLPMYIKRYNKNAGNKVICNHAYADIFYIPNEYAEIYEILSGIHSRNTLFLETAVTSILTFMINRTNIQHLEGGYLKTDLSFKKPFFHPVKLSKPNNLFFIRELFLPHSEVVKNYCRV